MHALRVQDQLARFNAVHPYNTRQSTITFRPDEKRLAPQQQPKEASSNKMKPSTKQPLPTPDDCAVRSSALKLAAGVSQDVHHKH